MASSHKKVIVRKMGRDSIGGYVSPANFVAEGKLELLNPSGKVVLIDLGEVKSVRGDKGGETPRGCSPDLWSPDGRGAPVRGKCRGSWNRCRRGGADSGTFAHGTEAEDTLPGWP